MRTVAASSTSKSPPDIRDTRRHLRDVDETATGQFDSASIVACLEDLENSLEGRFFSPKIYQGRPDPVTGELSLSEIGHMCATFVCGDKSKHEALKKMAAQSYYAGVLPALGNECKPSSQ